MTASTCSINDHDGKSDSNLPKATLPKATPQSKIVEYICRLDCMLLKFITSASEIRVVSIELYHAPSCTKNSLEEDRDEDTSVVE